MRIWIDSDGFKQDGRHVKDWKPGSFRVLLDGIDVTESCYEADTVAGLVKLLARDADGRIRQDPLTREPIREIKRGKVEVQTLLHSLN